MDKIDASFFYYMSLPLLIMVYLVLFTTVVPSKNNRQKYITALLGLGLALCLIFVFPALI